MSPLPDCDYVCRGACGLVICRDTAPSPAEDERICGDCAPWDAEDDIGDELMRRALSTWGQGDPA